MLTAEDNIFHGNRVTGWENEEAMAYDDMKIILIDINLLTFNKS